MIREIQDLSVQLDENNCFYVNIGGTEPICLSLAPWGFYGEYCEICGYPKSHDYHTSNRIEIVKHGSEKNQYEIFYKATYTPGLYYGEFYERSDRKIYLSQLYDNCKDLYTLLNYLNKVQPRINFLTALILCCKVTTYEVFYTILGKAMARVITTRLKTLDPSETIVTYTPRFKEDYKVDKFTGKTFNQAELLAKALARELKLNDPIETVYAKHSLKGKSQKKLSRYERYQLTHQAYELNPDVVNRIKGKNVILVDDVRTSGATVSAISKQLIQAKPRNIYVVVAGRSVLQEDFERFLSIELEHCKPFWLKQ